MLFRRLRDNQMVPASEACDASGAVKSGYAVSDSPGRRFVQPGDYLSFDIALMDRAPAPSSRVYLNDDTPGSVHLTDADRAAIIARAAMIHRTSTSYLGDEAPPFTEAMAHAAVSASRSAAAQVRDSAASFNEAAERERIKAEEARREMMKNLSNAYRN